MKLGILEIACSESLGFFLQLWESLVLQKPDETTGLVRGCPSFIGFLDLNLLVRISVHFEAM